MLGIGLGLIGALFTGNDDKPVSQRPALPATGGADVQTRLLQESLDNRGLWEQMAHSQLFGPGNLTDAATQGYYPPQYS